MPIFVLSLLSIMSHAFSRILYGRLPSFGYLFLIYDLKYFDNVPNILQCHLRAFHHWKLSIAIFRIFSLKIRLNWLGYQPVVSTLESIFCRFPTDSWIVFHSVIHHFISILWTFQSNLNGYLLHVGVLNFRGYIYRAIFVILTGFVSIVLSFIHCIFVLF